MKKSVRNEGFTLIELPGQRSFASGNAGTIYQKGDGTAIAAGFAGAQILQ